MHWLEFGVDLLGNDTVGWRKADYEDNWSPQFTVSKILHMHRVATATHCLDIT